MTCLSSGGASFGTHDVESKRRATDGENRPTPDGVARAELGQGAPRDQASSGGAPSGIPGQATLQWAPILFNKALILNRRELCSSVSSYMAKHQLIMGQLILRSGQ